jgi:serpin B
MQPFETTTTTVDQATVVSASQAFALDVYATLSRSDGNLFIAPHSLFIALTLNFAGARGHTAEQMAAVLHLPPNNAGLQAAVGAWVAESLRKGGPEGPQLLLANAMWGQKGLIFCDEFLRTIRDHFDGAFLEVDFARDPETARRLINTWVENQTQERIKDLLPPGLLDRLTRLVLTNAVYFKGNWAHPFKKQFTRPYPFKTLSNETLKVLFMFLRGKFKFARGPKLPVPGDYLVLELPYAGHELSMVLFLPGRVDGLADFEKLLTADFVTHCLSGLQSTMVEIGLPRFRMNWGLDLKEVLGTIGMSQAFDPLRADFSGITAGERLHIQAVIHKTFVDVNEEGTEAAAVTVVSDGSLGGPPKFLADHPFLFLIRDNRSESILFLGRVCNPLV